jgi:hypothetical protein
LLHRSSLVFASLPLLCCLVTAASVLPGCGGESGGDTGGAISGATFDPCAPLALVADTGASADQRSAVDAALALWNGVARSRLTLAAATPGSDAATGGPTIPIHFQAAADLFHGYYDPTAVQILINQDLSGEGATVAVSHEVGHAFGLVHVPPDQRASVMNPGNLNVEPTLEDAATLTVRWGSCP